MLLIVRQLPVNLDYRSLRTGFMVGTNRHVDGQGDKKKAAMSNISRNPLVA